MAKIPFGELRRLHKRLKPDAGSSIDNQLAVEAPGHAMNDKQYHFDLWAIVLVPAALILLFLRSLAEKEPR